MLVIRGGTIVEIFSTWMNLNLEPIPVLDHYIHCHQQSIEDEVLRLITVAVIMMNRLLKINHDNDGCRIRGPNAVVEWQHSELQQVPDFLVEIGVKTW
jgi:hypothetical protein